MKQKLPVISLALLLVGAGTLAAQAPQTAGSTDRTATAKAKATAAASDADVTHGRIKELTAGQKVVINVDNAPDKTFELADKDVAVKLGKGLKVGDPVQVKEHSVMGKTKSVTISKHTGAGVKHGEEKPLTK